MEQNIDIEVIDVEQFVILHIASRPPRIESKVIFDRDDISQKLIFKLMEITHNHGFGCSPPFFKGPNNSTMTFLIGTILPTKKSLNKYLKKMYNCLFDIHEFATDFGKQLDFSLLDLTMFDGMDLDEFMPEQIAAVRDQHYNGSWKKFYKSMQEQNRSKEANIISRCIAFEKANKKDIGLVGHRLLHIMDMVDGYDDRVVEAN